MYEDDQDEFNELLLRVRRLTGLGGREAAQVAFALDGDPKPQEIIDKAIELGFEVEKKHEDAAVKTGAFAAEVTMNPAEVLSEVYMLSPRVLCSAMPKLGRVPDEAQQYEGIEELMGELPEEIRLLLVKIDVLEGAATFWLRDEANDVDRPIGPIDLNRYIDESDIEGSQQAIVDAFMALLSRIDRVLAADFN